MKTYISAFILFVLGVSLGMNYHHFFHKRGHRPPPFHHLDQEPKDPSKHFVRKLSRKLDLNKEQKEKVLEIFKRQHIKLEVLRKESVPKFKEIRKETRDSINAILDEKQKVKFERLEERMRKRFGKR